MHRWIFCAQQHSPTYTNAQKIQMVTLNILNAMEKQLLKSKKLNTKISVQKVEDPQNPGTSWDGKVIRVNGRVNPATQTVQVFIQLSGSDLREGMYLSALIQGEEMIEAFEVQRNLLVQDNNLYIVENGALSLTSIEVLHKTNKTAIVRGLQDGMLVLAKAIPGTYAGMPVEINNSTVE